MHRQYIDIENPDTLSLCNDTIAAADAGEITIAVDFAGVNRADILQRLGLYPVPDDASPILGLEVAGKVAAIGPNVEGFEIGDSVAALVQGGGYATSVNARADHTLKLPANINSRSGAALPEALLTVWHNVFTLGRLKPDETLLVHGGGSGIGTMAIQMAKAWGARVVATAGGHEKCARVRSLGADLVLDYRSDTLREDFKNLALTGAIDVTLDMAGGDFTPLNFELAAPDGRIVCIGVMRGSKAEIELVPILMKRLTLTGSTLRGLGMGGRAKGFAALQETMMPLVAAGQIEPHIDTVFRLEEATAAQNRMQSGEHFGKILLDCRQT
ncbi:NAD(P)H-quinone oxidoreductase [Luminiphilus sp. nBUS_16]|uniref:NAD(P)H-quinone oxidoreductase n=1 Tax=Luminiphilus sp. nBUS_16 TaxID=3395315 RepID=UPI003EB6E32A